MYTLIRHLPIERAYQQIPAIGGALAIAEYFYRFHSFTLECAAFLTTWFAFDLAMVWVTRRLARRSAKPAGCGAAR